MLLFTEHIITYNLSKDFEGSIHILNIGESSRVYLFYIRDLES